MDLYKHLKKEHLFIFLALFTALVLFTYFNEDFSYTGLTTKNTCIDQGYQCCTEGQGINYFSLDNSCNNNQQCWTSCTESVKETNIITGSTVLNDIWSPIKSFFIKLFSKEAVGGVGAAQCQGKNILFTISEEVGGSHASKFTTEADAYSIPVCAEEFSLNDNGMPIIYLSGETNAHVEKFGLNPQNYPNPIKIKTNNNQNPECLYKQNCIPDREECLFSISGDTNAHVGACLDNNFPIYDTKLCCSLNFIREGIMLLMIVKNPAEG